MQTNEGRQAPPETKLTREDRALGELMAIWQIGEAARADPVLLNMQARVAAELARISPEAAAKGKALYERLTARGRA